MCQPKRSIRLGVIAVVGVLVLVAQPASGRQPDVSDQWRTPAEISGYRSTPSLDATVAFLKRLSDRLPMRLTSFGTSPQGRDMPLVIVSTDGLFTPQAAAEAGKPVILLQAGIHPGEVDGKDALLALLRDIVLDKRPRKLLEGATLLLVPVHNVDGHERVSPYNRANQLGPEAGMGFRTTAAGYDLNRDWLKAGAPETRALLRLVNRWRPHLHVDMHVTDGSDHDWVLTWSVAESPQLAPPVEEWIEDRLPAALEIVEDAGYRCGPYVSLLDRTDPAKGFSSVVGAARYSSGYFPLRNRPSILVEMHAYKPFRERVEALTEFLAAVLHQIGRNGQELVRAVTLAEVRTVELGRPDASESDVVLEWEPAEPDTIRFPAYDWEVVPSQVTGRPLLTFLRGKTRWLTVPWVHELRPRLTAPRPRGYLVRPGWPQVEARLRDHGLHVRRLTEPTKIEVETLWALEPDLAETPYQGCTRITADIDHRLEDREIQSGALWIPADQPDFEVAVQLLEPESPESLFAWGFLSTVVERKEYIAGANLEKLAREQIEDPAVREAWETALEDQSFAGNPRARYLWWYRRTPYWTVQEVGLVPVFRVLHPVELESEPWSGPAS